MYVHTVCQHVWGAVVWCNVGWNGVGLDSEMWDVSQKTTSFQSTFKKLS